MSKWLLITAAVILLVINGVLAYRLFLQKQTVSTTASPTSRQAVELTGTVKRGLDLERQKVNCPDGLYLVSSEGKTLIDNYTGLQLRSPDSATEEGKVLYANFVNQPVSITAEYISLTNPDEIYAPQDQNCFTDPYVLVKEIVSTDKNFNL